jgi:AcrR family transcriptional regulator
LLRSSDDEVSTVQAAATPEDVPTRTRILDAAEELFAAGGFAKTSVRDLAARVGITPASLYNHFRSKQLLYEAVLERGVRPLLELLQGLSDGEAQGEPENDVIEAVMAHLSRHPRVPRLVYHEAVSGGEHLAPLARRWIRPLVMQGVTAMKRDQPSVWDEAEAPLVIAAWLHLIFGYFATAPLMEEIVGADPLAPASLEQQTRFLRKLARLMSDART